MARGFSDGFFKPKKDGAIKRAGVVAAVASAIAGTTIRLTPPKGEYDGVSGEVALSNALNVLGLRKYATGSVVVGTGTLNFTNKDGTLEASRYAEVSQSLGFTPVVIVIYGPTGSSVYNFNTDFRANGATVCRIISCSNGTSIFYPYAMSGNANVGSTGFRIPYKIAETCTWEAWGA